MWGAKVPLHEVPRPTLFFPRVPAQEPIPAVKNYLAEFMGTRGGAWRGWWCLPPFVDHRAWERDPAVGFADTPGMRVAPQYHELAWSVAHVGGQRRPIFWDLTAEVGSELPESTAQPHQSVGGSTTHGVGAA